MIINYIIKKLIIIIIYSITLGVRIPTRKGAATDVKVP